MRFIDRLSEHFRHLQEWLKPRLVTHFLELVLLKAVLFSCRIEIRGIDTLLKRIGKEPCVLVVWHNRIPLFSHAMTTRLGTLPISAVISKSRDGEILSTIIQRSKNCQIIRVPHDARHRALSQIIHAVKKEKRFLLLTPDGPRGPRYQCKPGAILAAEATGAPIIGVTWSSSQFWQLGSWDKMVIPKPFSRIILAISDPIDLSEVKGIKEKGERLDSLLTQFDEQICAAVSPDRSRWPK